MGVVAVLAAAVAAFVWGAVWYMAMAKPWMAASGLSEDTINRSNPVPYVISIVGLILVAGMMRHTFVMAGIDTLGKGLMAGLGVGLFIVLPWIATHYAFGQRPMRLIAIDAGYHVIGCAIIGVVLTLL